MTQYTARLLNAIASLCEGDHHYRASHLHLTTSCYCLYASLCVAGRSYLATNADLMRNLMDHLRAQSTDALTRENVLGCLQKLSLRLVNLNTDVINVFGTSLFCVVDVNCSRL